MTTRLNLDEMLEVLKGLEPAAAAVAKAALEAVGTSMAEIIAEKLGVETDEATSEGVAFGGTLAPFLPRTAGQACPAELAEYDLDGWEA